MKSVPKGRFGPEMDAYNEHVHQENVRKGIREYENTFAPNVRNKYLAIGAIIAGLKQSAFRLDDLPPDVRKEVGEELKRREK